MMKRNEGYALSYVLVVLLVLALIAVSVLSPPLRNLQNQQASIARMQEKYSAQGKVEQVVAQLECSTGTTIDAVITSIAIPSDTTCTKDSENELTIFVTCEGTTITAEVILEKQTKTEGEGTEQTTTITGYTVTYKAYNVEVTP